MKIPLTNFKGFLKQIDASQLGARERASLNAALPHFWPAEQPDNWHDQIRSARDRLQRMLGDSHGMLPGQPITWQAVPNRRFSGGDDLPRGRYYTICKDSSGGDDLTLLSEMAAYRSVRRSALCSILDTQELPHSLFDDQLRPKRNSMFLVFVDDPNLPNHFINELDQRFGGGQRLYLDTHQLEKVRAVYVELPYRILNFEIQMVLDLRRITAQEWFYEMFSVRRKSVYVAFEGSQATDFTDMLPWLMTMELGGSTFTEGVGNILRRNKVNAFIYPSARSDCYAIQAHRRLAKSAGWCLVDYRNAPDCEGRAVLETTEQTPFPFGDHPRILYWPEDGRDKGSWAVEGVREYYRARMYWELQNFIGTSRASTLTKALRIIEGDITT